MSTTFNDLIAQPYIHKVILAEISVGERITFSTQVLGNTYKLAPFLYEAITTRDGLTHQLVEKVTAMTADGISLAAQTGLANVEAVNNSFWHDTTNQVLYANTGGGGGTATPPNTQVMMAYFQLNFSSEGVCLNGAYYAPYVQSAPAVSYASQQLLSGYLTIGNGNLVLNNADGLFDRISARHTWENATVTIKVGGGDAGYPYSEFKTAFVGKVITKTWDMKSFTLYLRDRVQDLQKQIPTNTMTLATYPRLYIGNVGKPVPLGYGVFDYNAAPIVPAVDEAVGTASVKYLLNSNPANSIQGVYVSQDNGSTWTAASLSATGFPTIPAETTGYVYNWGLSGQTTLMNVRFNAVAYDNTKTKVKVAMSISPYNFAGDATYNPALIVQDLLAHPNAGNSGGVSAGINTTTFTTSKNASSAKLMLWLDKFTRLSDVITKICISDLAYFFSDNNGLYSYVTWTPNRSATVPNTLYDMDVLDLSVIFTPQDQFTAVQVGYDMDNAGKYIYSSQSSVSAQNQYALNSSKTVDTYLQDPVSAATLAGRLLLIQKQPVQQIKIKTALQGFQMNNSGTMLSIGDKAALNLTRCSDPTGALNGTVFEVASVSRDYVAGTADLVLVSYTGYNTSGVGFWAATAALSWPSAGLSDKAVSGYWCDANGYATPGDGSSLNVSSWW